MDIFATAVVTNYYRLGGGLNQQSLFSHISGDYKSEVKMSAGLFPSWGHERKDSSWPLSLAKRWLSCYFFTLYVSVSKFPLIIRVPVLME